MIEKEQFVTIRVTGLTKLMLLKVRYSPQNKFKLFSVTKLLMHGWDPGGDGIAIRLRKNEQTIKFDINIKTKEGIIFAIYVNQEFPTQEVAAAGGDFGMKVIINKAHELLGHMNEYKTRASEKALGWEITRGSMKPCE